MSFRRATSDVKVPSPLRPLGGLGIEDLPLAVRALSLRASVACREIAPGTAAPRSRLRPRPKAPRAALAHEPRAAGPRKQELCKEGLCGLLEGVARVLCQRLTCRCPLRAASMRGATLSGGVHGQVPVLEVDSLSH